MRLLFQGPEIEGPIFEGIVEMKPGFSWKKAIECFVGD
jgi:hypothetical protein